MLGLLLVANYDRPSVAAQLVFRLGKLSPGPSVPETIISFIFSIASSVNAIALPAKLFYGTSGIAQIQQSKAVASSCALWRMAQ